MRPIGPRLFEASLQYRYDSAGLQAGTCKRYYADSTEARRDIRVLRDQNVTVHVDPAAAAKSRLVWEEVEPLLAVEPPFVREMEPISAGTVRTVEVWSALGLACSTALLTVGFGLAAWSPSLWVLGALLVGGVAILAPTQLLRLKLASTSRRPGTAPSWAAVPAWQRVALAVGAAAALATFLRYSLQLRVSPRDAEIPDVFFYRWLCGGLAWTYAYALVFAIQAGKHISSDTSAAHSLGTGS